MSKEIRKAITETFGFEDVCINSALVSAQNRQRLYWVGKRNPDGTYSKVDVEQPHDRGILLKDVLDGVTDREKGRAVIGSTGRTTDREYFKKNQGNMSFEPVGTTKDGKSQTIKAQYSHTDVNNICRYTSTYGATGVAEPVNTTQEGKAQCIRATCYKDGIRNMVGNTVDRRTAVAEPVTSSVQVCALPRPNGELSQSQAFRIYDTNAKSVTLKACAGGAGGKTGLYSVPVKVGEVGNGGQGNRIYTSNGKAVTQQANSGGLGSNTGLYAIPVEFEGDKPIKAMSGADGKTYKVYEVKNGQVAIKDKTYPIKLQDGLYIIRKLTVSECKRLQTVPEWYEFPVSDTQAYKMLGSGWTVDVIVHLIKATLN